MKAIVLLSELAAMRRGEIRALRWRCVDFDKRLITIEENYTDLDGFKPPKRESSGVVPMTSELKTVLQDLHKKAFSLGRAAPEDLVVFNVKREEPIADVTMKRGFKRAPRPHRHRGRRRRRGQGRANAQGPAASRLGTSFFIPGDMARPRALAESIGPRDAARITRHRSAPSLSWGYSDHDTDEMLDKGEGSPQRYQQVGVHWEGRQEAEGMTTHRRDSVRVVAR